jgi:ABC-type transport system substrate-binding protein
MNEIYIDGTLEPMETANWFPKVIRKDYTVGANISETAVDDPDQMLYENYACGSDRNYTGFGDKEVDALIDRQSAEPNAEKRRQLGWEIERWLARRLQCDHLLYPCRDLLAPTREGSQPLSSTASAVSLHTTSGDEARLLP